MKPVVYFSKEISPEKVVEMYHKLGIELPGKVAVKLHSGEKGNQNFLRPEFWKPMIEEIAEFLVENERKGLLLTGYADNQGTAEYCIGISRQRAMEVKKALVLLGIDGKRIEIEAKGDENPIGDNSTYEGRIQNNRVTIQIQ